MTLQKPTEVKTTMSEALQLSALEIQRKAKLDEAERKQLELEKFLPMPVGYHILIELLTTEETFRDSGIAKTNKAIRDEYILSTVGVVLKLGDQAYSDKDRYPTGPWCKEEDAVMFRANTGTRFTLGTKEFRLMNDDSIQAVVPEPKLIDRA